MEIEKIVKLFSIEGIKIQDNDVRELQEAIDNNRFFILQDKGFLSWEEKNKYIFIKNLLIFKDKRNHKNLLQLREMFRKKYPNKILVWKNRKRNLPFPRRLQKEKWSEYF